MSKRPNEASGSEPVAKRTAAHLAERLTKEDTVLAQAALDRLDFKSAEEICTQAFGKRPLNEESLLLIRSLAYERKGQLEASLKDAQKSLSSQGKDYECNSRTAYAHLALARHHLQISQLHNPRRGRESEVQDFEEMMETLAEIKRKESKSFFERFSPELFSKILSMCDSPTLSIASCVSRNWRETAFDNLKLWKSFRMTGYPIKIAKGLDLFNFRCQNSVSEIDLNVYSTSPPITTSQRSSLERSLITSSSVMETLSVQHDGDLGDLVASIVEKCSALKVLRSISKTIGNKFANQGTVHSFSFGSAAQLQVLEWICGRSKGYLHVDLALIEMLSEAREVKLDVDMTESFVVQLLSSSQTFERVLLNGITFGPVEHEIESMNLPNLKLLQLSQVPIEPDEDYEGNSFSKNLEAPQLQALHLKCLHPRWLPLLKAGPALKTFEFERFDDEVIDGFEPNDQVVLLLRSMRSWNKLESLMITEASKRVFYQLVRALNLLSRESIRGSTKSEAAILPNLSTLQLGRLGFYDYGGDPYEPNLAFLLVCLVSSRSAAFQGMSKESIFSASNGFTRVPPAQELAQPSALGISACLDSIKFYFNGDGDDESLDWLREHLPNSDLDLIDETEYLQEVDDEVTAMDEDEDQESNPNDLMA